MTKFLLGMVMGIFILGCSTPAAPPRGKIDSQAQPTQNLGQMLPITARAVLPNRTKVDLEVARTPEQQAMGLMYRESLPDKRGMLFEFPSPQPVSFWMKNTLIPLDMVFLRAGVVQFIQVSAPPCTADPCPSYGPSTQIDQVIELGGGRAAQLGLKVGDRIQIDFLQPQNPSP
ncbi:MAG: DUF192 domain-containing protein [Nostocaceae cyanobacterium]|nr:DUF192 domain-containing protein [Nostocaceae cyanobacterium]